MISSSFNREGEEEGKAGVWKSAVPGNPPEIDVAETKTITWRARLKWELTSSSPLFFLEEPPLDGTPTRYIDVTSSFAPKRPFLLTFWARLFLLVWSVQVLALDVSTYPPHNLFIYMGYLTHWGHALSLCYFTASLLCVLVFHSTRQPRLGEQPGLLVRTTWCLYGIVAPLEIAITLLYWSAVASGPVTYVSVMEHGVLSILVLIDGLVIGLVPMRAKHAVFLLGVCTAYAVWSILDAVLEIGNGDWGPAYEDDALYPVLNWRRQTTLAAFLCSFAICILSPALFLLCWMLSLASPRTSVATNQSKKRCASCCNCEFNGSRRPLFEEEVREIEGDISATDYTSLGVPAATCGARCGHVVCYGTAVAVTAAMFAAFVFAAARWYGYLPP